MQVFQQREVGNMALISAFCHHQQLRPICPQGAYSSYQSVIKLKKSKCSFKEMMGTLLCAFRKRQPWSIALLNVIKVPINIHAQHLYSKHLIISLQKKKSEWGMGREEITVSLCSKEFKVTEKMNSCTSAL